MQDIKIVVREKLVYEYEDEVKLLAFLGIFGLTKVGCNGKV